MSDTLSDQLAMLPFWFLLALLTVLGAIWGSFVGALVSRWPKGESAAKGRSRCERCGKQISSYDLIPIISYLLLKGKCRNCGQKIGSSAIWVEIASSLLGALPILLFAPGQAIGLAIFGWLLLPLLILDCKHLWLPDRLVLLLAVAALPVGTLVASDVSAADRAVGIVAGFLSLEFVRIAYKHYRGQDGMGAGDPKLFGALGLWLGWQALPMVLLLASAIGIALFLVMRSGIENQRGILPFGSYLAVAAYLTAVVG